MTDRVRRIVVAAARAAGFRSDRVVLLRQGSHGIYRLPGGVVARVGGRSVTLAGREVEAARWLNRNGLASAVPIDGPDQPTVVEETPVTWWRELPPHRPSSPRELGATLLRLHGLPAPLELSLPSLDPSVDLGRRIRAAVFLPGDERSWLESHLDDLVTQWSSVAPPHSMSLVHGDAWQGNVVVTTAGDVTLLDLEHLSLGDSRWDLVPLAADHVDFGRVSAGEYADFVDGYGGYDVRTWPGFRTASELMELRWACFALGRASMEPHLIARARHRVDCLRGTEPRPWSWPAV